MDITRVKSVKKNGKTTLPYSMSNLITDIKVLTIARCDKCMAGDLRYLYDLPYNEIPNTEDAPELYTAWQKVLYQFPKLSIELIQKKLLLLCLRYRESIGQNQQQAIHRTEIEIKRMEKQAGTVTDVKGMFELIPFIAVGLGISLSAQNLTVAEFFSYLEIYEKKIENSKNKENEKRR